MMTHPKIRLAGKAPVRWSRTQDWRSKYAWYWYCPECKRRGLLWGTNYNHALSLFYEHFSRQHRNRR